MVKMECFFLQRLCLSEHTEQLKHQSIKKERWKIGNILRLQAIQALLTTYTLQRHYSEPETVRNRHVCSVLLRFPEKTENLQHWKGKSSSQLKCQNTGLCKGFQGNKGMPLPSFSLKQSGTGKSLQGSGHHGLKGKASADKAIWKTFLQALLHTFWIFKI